MIWIIIFSYLTFTTQYSKIMSSSELNQPLSGSLLAVRRTFSYGPNRVEIYVHVCAKNKVQRDRSCGGSFDT